MTPSTRAALEDLLTVQAISQITPHRLIAWQNAARAVLAPGPSPKPVSGNDKSDKKGAGA